MADTENYCAAQTYRATLETPAEYCENEVENEGDYCSEHGGEYDEYDEPADFDDYKNGEGRYAPDYHLDDY